MSSRNLYKIIAILLVHQLFVQCGSENSKKKKTPNPTASWDGKNDFHSTKWKVVDL